MSSIFSRAKWGAGVHNKVWSHYDIVLASVNSAICVCFLWMNITHDYYFCCIPVDTKIPKRPLSLHYYCIFLRPSLLILMLGFDIGGRDCELKSSDAISATTTIIHLRLK